METVIRSRCTKILLPKSTGLTVDSWCNVQAYVFNCKTKIYQLDKDPELVNQEYSRFKFETDDNYEFVYDKNGKKIKKDFMTDVPPQIMRNGTYRWAIAYNRFSQGVSEEPVFKKSHEKNSVYITNELFSLSDVECQYDEKKQKTVIVRFSVTLHDSGKKKLQETFDVNLGSHGIDNIPNAINIKKIRENYWISFPTNEIVDGNLMSKKELMDIFSRLPKSTLEEITVGIDRGVKIPFYANGSIYVLEPKLANRIVRAVVGLKRHQKILSRKIKTKNNGGKAVQKGQKGKPFIKGLKIELSKNALKTKEKIANKYVYIRNVRKDFIHKVTHELVSNDNNGIFVLEDLKITNMTKKAQAKEVNGVWCNNRKRQKAGLNRAILNVGWGIFANCLTYKAEKQNKLVIKVPPHHTSQKCHHCGSTSAKNRVSQSEFYCVTCGHYDNADHNANQNIKDLGIAHLINSKISIKEPKKTGFKKKTGGNKGIPPTNLMDSENVCGGIVSLGHESDHAVPTEAEINLSLGNL